MAANTADRLRFEASVQATQLALDKWTKAGYGTGAIKDPVLRAQARRLHVRLSAAIKAAQSDG